MEAVSGRHHDAALGSLGQTLRTGRFEFSRLAANHVYSAGVFNAPASRQRAWFIFFLLVLPLAASAATNSQGSSFSPAQIAPAPAVPDAACPLSGPVQEKVIAPPISHKPISRNRSCLVSAAEVVQLTLKNKAQIVDVRSPAEYQQIHLPESINIPLHLVRTKTFLKNSKIVLVNTGRSTAELEKHCSELKQTGFKDVVVLEGGLQAWEAEHRPLAGMQDGSIQLNHMTPSELFVERLYTDWVVVAVTSKAISGDMRQWLPLNTTTVVDKTANGQADAVRAIVARKGKSGTASKLLIVADNNDATARLQARLRLKGVLYLDGGLNAYQDFISKQSAIWAQQSQPKKVPACRG